MSLPPRESVFLLLLFLVDSNTICFYLFVAVADQRLVFSIIIILRVCWGYELVYYTHTWWICLVVFFVYGGLGEMRAKCIRCVNGNCVAASAVCDFIYIFIIFLWSMARRGRTPQPHIYINIYWTSSRSEFFSIYFFLFLDVRSLCG